MADQDNCQPMPDGTSPAVPPEGPQDSAATTGTRTGIDRGDTDAMNQAAVTEELEIMRETMAELDPSLLELLVLRYFCDLDSNEISQTLGLNASTARCRLQEARIILAQKLPQRGVEP